MKDNIEAPPKLIQLSKAVGATIIKAEALSDKLSPLCLVRISSDPPNHEHSYYFKSLSLGMV